MAVASASHARQTGVTPPTLLRELWELKGRLKLNVLNKTERFQCLPRKATNQKTFNSVQNVQLNGGAPRCTERFDQN